MTLTKLQKSRNFLEEHQCEMACPLCGSMLTTEETSLRCEKGHTFDLSRKGYVNFRAAAPQTPYNTQLFVARARTFERGFYEPVVALIGQVMKEYAPAGAALDAGCGEGFYVSRLAEEGRPFYGLDISRQAIAAATDYPVNAGWLIGDLAHLPFAGHSLAAVINVLSPANYLEFDRVLKPNGVLIKVMPGSNYMCQLRQRAGLPAYDEEKVPDYLESHMQVLFKQTVEQTFMITAEAFADLCDMSPLTFGLSAEEKQKIKENPADAITIQMQVVVAGKNKKKL